jgi:CRP/FNR family cyclic AMP-dependent transcriptional regulator
VTGIAVAYGVAIPKEVFNMAIAPNIDLSSHIIRRTAPLSPEQSALEAVPALAGLPSSFLSALSGASTVRHFSRHGVVCQEGVAPGHVFVVMRGKVRAVRRSGSGREVTLETFQPGDFLGDALGGRPLTNDWEASEPTDLLAISREVFASQLQSAPSLGLTLLTQTLSRLEKSKTLASGLALADVSERVVASLRSLANSLGKDVPEGVAVQNRPTQQELANSIGACRETVSRVISDLARKGLISLKGRSMIVSRRLLSESRES